MRGGVKAIFLTKKKGGKEGKKEEITRILG